MTLLSDRDLHRLVRETCPPPSGGTPPDLWPRMRERLGQDDSRRMSPEWVLAGALTALWLSRADLLTVLFLYF